MGLRRLRESLSQEGLGGGLTAGNVVVDVRQTEERLLHTSVQNEIKETAVTIMNHCVTTKWGDGESQLDEVSSSLIGRHIA